MAPPPPSHNSKEASANRRPYLYAGVSVLLFLAVVSYNKASAPPAYLALMLEDQQIQQGSEGGSSAAVGGPNPRELASLPGAAQTNIFGLLQGVDSKKTDGWLSKTSMVDASASTTRFRNHLLPLKTRRVNVAPYLSDKTIADAETFGIMNELNIAQRPSWNSISIPIICGLRDGLEPRAPSCEKDLKLKKVVHDIKAYGDLTDSTNTGSVDAAHPLPTYVVRGEGIGSLRSWIGQTAWEQTSLGALGNYRYTLTSATKAPLWMCTGEHQYWNPIEVANGGKGMKAVTYGVEATLSARQWNKAVSNNYLRVLKAAVPKIRLPSASSSSAAANEVEKSSANGVATELLLKKVRVWSPFSAPLTEANVQDAVLRPSLVCITLTTRPNLRTALLQHTLWGYQCDEFVILYTTQEHEEHLYTAEANPFNPNGAPNNNGGYDVPGADLSVEDMKLINASGVKVDHVVKLHSLPPFAKRKTDGYDLAWYRYRQAMEWLDYWPEMSRHSYVYIATETVYALPENIHAMLLQPEYRLLHAAGTPLYAGNRMIAEIRVNRQSPEKGVVYPNHNVNYKNFYDKKRHEKNSHLNGEDQRNNTETISVPYIHMGAGVLFSASAIRLMSILFESGQCADGAFTGNPDVLLAQCLASTGITPRDTADVLGEDRFHPLSPLELLASVGVDHSSSASSAITPAQIDSWWLLHHKPKYQDAKYKENPLRLLSGLSAAFGGILTPEQMVWMHRVLRG